MAGITIDALPFPQESAHIIVVFKFNNCNKISRLLIKYISKCLFQRFFTYTLVIS